MGAKARRRSSTPGPIPHEVAFPLTDPCPPAALGRCPWGELHPLLTAYHDEEWGVPLTDDRKLFEFIVLEGAQAGLSWLTILKKRPGYRRAFHDFDPQAVARMGEEDVERLIQNSAIIRNRRKIAGTLTNARAFLAVQERFGSFARYLWDFFGGIPRQNSWERPEDVPPLTPEAERLSADLKRRGFVFVGPTVCYSHMQAVGMVNDHLVSCFRHAAVAALGKNPPL